MAEKTQVDKIFSKIKNTGKDINILIAFNTLSHDPQNPDAVSDILIET